MRNTGFFYVKEIAQEKSFSKAAKKIGVSQPALSAYINKMEKKLGVRLFDRSISPIEITEFGKCYLEYAESVLCAEERFEKAVSDLSQMKKGTITLGSTACFSSSYLPKAIVNFNNKYPDINFNIIEGKVPQMQEKCLAGEVDMFLSDGNINEEIFEKEDLFHERIIMTVPENFKINEELKEYAIPVEEIIRGNLNDNKYKDVDLSYFKDEKFILLYEDQRIRKIINRVFEEYKIKPKEIMLVPQTTTGLAMTIAGMGVSFAAESAIKFSNFEKHPIYYRIGSEKTTGRSMCVVYKKGKYISKAGRIFIDELKSIF